MAIRIKSFDEIPGNIRRAMDMLKKYPDVFNTPDEDNDVEIKDGIVQLKVNGKVIMTEDFNGIIRPMLDRMSYVRNQAKTDDFKYSPLEADRKENKKYWKNDYRHINFPRFIGVLFAFVLANRTVPTYDEFSLTYIYTYTAKVSGKAEDLSVYKVAYPGRNTIGNIISSAQFEFEDQMIKFNKLGLRYSSGLPKNEFTLFDILTRIYKVYGSIVRDFENAIIVWGDGVSTYYSYRNDMKGTDLLVNGKMVRAYTKNPSGIGFAKIKVDERHPNLYKKHFIMLKADVTYVAEDELVRTSDKAIQHIRKYARLDELPGNVTITVNC